MRHCFYLLTCLILTMTPQLSSATPSDANFFCGTDAGGVFKAETAKFVCPKGATTDLPSGSNQVLCMYSANCFPAHELVKQLVTRVNGGRPLNRITDDEVNRTMVAAAHDPVVAPQMAALGINRIQASVTCLSDSDGKCPKVNACLQMKNGGAFGWAYTQKGEGSQGFSMKDDPGNVPTAGK